MAAETFGLVISGGTVVTAEQEADADIGITDERIAAVGPGLPGRDEVDATGLLALPVGSILMATFRLSISTRLARRAGSTISGLAPARLRPAASPPSAT